MINFRFISILILGFLLTVFTGCSEEKVTRDSDSFQQFTLLSPTATLIEFENRISESPTRNIGGYDYFYNGSGVGVGDINNDGLPDVFFGGNDVKGRLYINKGDFVFEETTDKSGINAIKWTTGVTMVDINNDGWLDIYLCNSGPYTKDDLRRNELYINNGDNTFSEKASEFGIDDPNWSTQASFFDMDNDGDLDLFVMNHGLRNLGKSFLDWINFMNDLPKERNIMYSNRLFRNEGNGSFTDVTETSGVFKAGFGLGLITADLNEDGLTDIYVANDYFIPDYYYVNLGNGKFVDRSNDYMGHTSYYSMGADAADINNDGILDIGIVDMTPADHYRNKTLMASMNVPKFDYMNNRLGFLPQYMFNTLHVGNGLGMFSEVSLYAGISQTDWSWTSLFVDFDNDGLKDYLVTNGYKRDTKDNDWRIRLSEKRKANRDTWSVEDYYDMLLTAKSTPLANHIYRNNGELKFEDKSKEWGFTDRTFSHGAAFGDFDNDGDLDLVINNLEQKAFIYRNNSDQLSDANYIQFNLSDKNGAPLENTSLVIHYGDKSQRFDYILTRGYQSSMEPLVHFGLGSIEHVDKVTIKWPDGSISEIQDPQINKRHKIERSALDEIPFKPEASLINFQNITTQAGIDFKHIENDYNDFAREVLLPHKQSTSGPAIAVGDVDKNGLQDFFVGGAKGQAGALFLQSAGKPFTRSESTPWSADIESEDVGAVFFDADNDGDLDLYVCSGGGGEFLGEESKLQDRLYLNDGTGKFTRDISALPQMLSSTRSVVPNDWDQDGDLDLFVGGRTVPGKYPYPESSYLLRNEGGTFTIVNDELLPQLNEFGMVTEAAWVNLDGKGGDELVIVGEWMPVMVFSYDGEAFVDQTEAMGLSDLQGWWHSISYTDVDNDGDQDLIAGNIGLNNKFHPSEKKPLHVYCNDFDDNGTLDIVLSKVYRDTLVPVRGRECSSQQMPFIKDKFPTYSAFASADIEDIYSKEKLKEAVYYKVTDFASYVLINEDGKSFKKIKLPYEAQLFPINGVVIGDYNGDGNNDLVMAGNVFNTEVETARYDAGKGLYLKGNGDGTFDTSLKIENSGLLLDRNVKDLAPIMIRNSPGFICANNNDFLSIWRYVGYRDKELQ